MNNFYASTNEKNNMEISKSNEKINSANFNNEFQYLNSGSIFKRNIRMQSQLTTN